MLRKYGSIAAALTAVLACLVAFVGAPGWAKPQHAAAGHAARTVSARTVIPGQGTYTGWDHQGNAVTLVFSGNQVTSFHVSYQAFGNAHVSSDSWSERCNGGWCFKGHWVSATEVVGEWRHGSSSTWHAWSAYLPTPKTYYQGSFLGSDHHGNTVRVRFNGTHIHSFTVNGYGSFPSTTIDHSGQWTEVCSSDWCYRGRFEDDYSLVGEWRTPGSVWHPWEARAFSA